MVLCLDEAQAMPLETLEALRLLTNLETEKRKLLQIVLFGQPELDRKLEQDSVRQLKQRITFHYRLGALRRDELDSYSRTGLPWQGIAGPVVQPGCLEPAVPRQRRRATAGEHSRAQGAVADLWRGQGAGRENACACGGSGYAGRESIPLVVVRKSI